MSHCHTCHPTLSRPEARVIAFAIIVAQVVFILCQITRPFDTPSVSPLTPAEQVVIRADRQKEEASRLDAYRRDCAWRASGHQRSVEEAHRKAGGYWRSSDNGLEWVPCR